MSLSSLIADHTFLIAFGLVGVFCLWKFVIQPIINEGEPIEPTDEQVEGFGLDKINRPLEI